MQRYFIRLAYNGTRYAGWQRQPEAPSVQQTLEETFATVLRYPVELTGCGRTDAGVHARVFFAHTDLQPPLPELLLHRLNRMLPPDIALLDLFPVQADAHARFDATYRAYQYVISFQKNPFEQHTGYYYPYREKPDPHLMQDAASLLLNYEYFFPFCKADHDAHTVHCSLYESQWTFQRDGQGAIFRIAANRFLRGMVRLIVGMCLEVGTGKLTLDTVRQAMDRQERLKKSISAPPNGLFLSEIRYPFL